MKVKRILKKLLLTLFILIALFLIYSLIPRVRHPNKSFATELKKSDILSKDFQKNLRQFIKDTASGVFYKLT